MPQYLSPGVYVEEAPSGNPAIQGVGTSTPAFIGLSHKGPVNEPTLITDAGQFTRVFGEVRPEFALAYAVQQFFHQGGRRCYVVRAYKANTTGANQIKAGFAQLDISPLTIFAASPGTWGNRLKIEIAPAGFHPKADPDSFMLTVLVGNDPVASYDQLSAAPTAPDPISGDDAPNPNFIGTVVGSDNPYISVAVDTTTTSTSVPTTQATPLAGGDNGAALDPADYADSSSSTAVINSLDKNQDFSMIAIPELFFNVTQADLTQARDAALAATAYAENRGDCVFIIDTPLGLTVQEALDFRNGTGTSPGNAFDSSYGAMYYPWIVIDDPVTGNRMPFPPSGAMAGVWAETDARVGVQKAPAGTTDGYLRVASDIEQKITTGEQELLNPVGVNVIRKFVTDGIVVWGARTVSFDQEAFRYLNVRRLFIFLEQSIKRGTRSFVFDPNDPSLWRQITASVSAFLRVQWEQGLLVGDKPADAFFVNCNAETNPPESVAMGRVITEIGVAPSRPAEFVIFRISQYLPT